MALDKAVRDMFRTFEKLHGRKYVEGFARGTRTDAGDPAATLALAEYARQYFLEEYNLRIVLSAGEVLDQARMARFVASRKGVAPRVNPPLLDDLRPTTKVRDSIGRESKVTARRARTRKKEESGRVAYTGPDGKVHWVHPFLYKLLTMDPPANG